MYDQAAFLLGAFPNSTLSYRYHSHAIPIVNNWVSALRMASGNIVKLLFSDDLVLSEPCPSAFSELLSSKECAFISTPAWIGDESSRDLNYAVSTKLERIRSDVFVNGILYTDM